MWRLCISLSLSVFSVLINITDSACLPDLLQFYWFFNSSPLLCDPAVRGVVMNVKCSHSPNLNKLRWNHRTVDAKTHALSALLGNWWGNSKSEVISVLKQFLLCSFSDSDHHRSGSLRVKWGGGGGGGWWVEWEEDLQLRPSVFSDRHPSGREGQPQKHSGGQVEQQMGRRT